MYDTLATTVTAFASHRDMTVVPAVPERDLGPEAHLYPTVVDIDGFLDLAGTLGGGVLYLDTAPLRGADLDATGRYLWVREQMV